MQCISLNFGPWVFDGILRISLKRRNVLRFLVVRVYRQCQAVDMPLGLLVRLTFQNQLLFATFVSMMYRFSLERPRQESYRDSQRVL